MSVIFSVKVYVRNSSSDVLEFNVVRLDLSVSVTTQVLTADILA